MSSWKENQLSKADSDEDLIVKVGQGDIRAFEVLVNRHQKSALRAAQRFVFDRQEAEDLAQEAFLTIFRKARSYEPKASFKTWFFTILLNLCRNSIKKKKPVYFGSLPEMSEVASSHDPSSQFDRRQIQQALANAIARLPENQRAAFILCHYENFSYAEAAKAIGVSVKAVESLLVRAKRSLREGLGQYVI
ncbi:MAG: RNA polymerase sigma factor [Blastocatellia bacterium]